MLLFSRCFSSPAKQAHLIMPWLTRTLRWGASPCWVMALRDGSSLCICCMKAFIACWKHRRTAKAAFHRRHARWIWFKQVFQRLRRLLGLPACSHPQGPLCPAIFYHLLNPPMLWDLIFLFDGCEWTTETCAGSDLRSFPVVWQDFSNCVS